MFKRKGKTILMIASVCLILHPIFATAVGVGPSHRSGTSAKIEAFAPFLEPTGASDPYLPELKDGQLELAPAEAPIESGLAEETTEDASPLTTAEAERSSDSSSEKEEQPSELETDALPAGALALTSTNFPDPVFLNALKTNSKKTIFEEINGTITGMDLGSNPQYITKEKLTAIISVDLSSSYQNPSELRMLEGIQNFTSLKYLSISNTKVTSVLRVPNTLIRLTASNTELNSIWLARFRNLRDLHLSDDLLTEIDVSQNTKLENILIGTSAISELDVSNCPSLTHLTVLKTPNLTSINTKRNPELIWLQLSGGVLTEIDLTNNPKLEELSIDDLPNLKAIKRGNLPELNAIMLSRLPPLQQESDQFNFSGSPKLDDIKVMNTAYKVVDVSHNSALTSLTVNGNSSIKKIDLSGTKNALTYLEIGDTPFKEFDLTQMPNLERLSLDNNDLKKVTLTDKPRLYNLYLSDNDLENLDVSKNPKLKLLMASNNRLAQLDLSQNTALNRVDVRNNHLTTLDLSKQQALTSFYGDGQTSRALTTQNGDKWNVAFSNVVGGANLGKVSNLSSPWSYQTSNGLASSSSLTDTLNYEYNVGSPKPNIQPLRVSLDLNQAATLTLTPDKPEVESGETVTWTAIFTNFDPVYKLDRVRMNVNYLGITPGSQFQFVKNSGTIRMPNTGIDSPLADHYFTNAAYTNINPGAANGQTVKVTFKTTVTGQPDQSFKAELMGLLNEGLASPLMLNSAGTVKIKNKDQVVKPNEGEIALRSIPNQFKFHDLTALANTRQTVKLDPAEYNQFSQDKGLYVKIRDSRTTNVGWKLTVGMDPLTNTANGEILADAEIHLRDATVKEVHNPDTIDETVGEITSPNPPVVKSSDIVIKGGDQHVPVMAASTGGIGTWNLILPLANVQLEVPAKTGIAGHSYSSTFYWTLTDAP